MVAGSRIADNDDIPDLKAWLDTLQGPQATQNPHLVKCLARALCLSKTSTSACERDFANVIQTFRKRLASPMLKEMHLRVTSFLRTEPGESPEVIRRAQAIWNEGFSQCRQSGVERKGNFVSGLKLQKKRQDTWMNLVRIMESTYRLSPIPCHCQTEAKYFICQWLSRLRTLFRARLHGSNGDA